MEVVVKHPQYATSMEIKIDEKTRLYFNPITSGSNCKLMTLEHAGQLFSGITNEETRKEIVKEIMKHFTGRNMLITLLNEQHINWLRDNFDHYYCVTVPIGYTSATDTNQYHILLKNNADTRQPIKYVAVKNAKDTITKDKVLEIVNAAFLHSENRKKRIEYIAGELDSFKVSL